MGRMSDSVQRLPRAMIEVLKQRVAALCALRALAVCCGLFAGVNVLVALVDGGVDSNLLWIDLRVLPPSVRSALGLLVAALLVGFGLRPRLGRWRTLVTRFVFVAACAWAVRDGIVVLLLSSDGAISVGSVPLSFVVACFFGSLSWAADCNGRSALADEDGPAAAVAARLVGVGLGAALFLVGLPLAEIVTLGNTDYRRPPTDGIGGLGIVLGAGVRADGTPSLALNDRVLTGVDLYHEGVVTNLIFSGGPGPGAVHETEAMRDLALEHGVPVEHIHLDAQGLSTWATAKNAAAWTRASSAGPFRLFAVSHAYHLPRVELAFQRHGLDVLTVPAQETRPLARRHYFALREVAGFWVYWARRIPAALEERASASELALRKPNHEIVEARRRARLRPQPGVARRP